MLEPASFLLNRYRVVIAVCMTFLQRSMSYLCTCGATASSTPRARSPAAVGEDETNHS